MLPKSRILAAFFCGVGCALIAAAVYIPQWWYPEPRLSTSHGAITYTLVDEDAEISASLSGESSQGNGERGIVKQINFDFHPPITDDDTVVRVGISEFRLPSADTDHAVEDESERLLNAEVWSYHMSRTTGLAVSDADVAETIGTPARTLSLEGQWLSFPTNVQKTDYDFFDSTLRIAQPAHYVSETTIDAGRHESAIYTFHQSIAPEMVAAHYASDTGQSILSTGERGYLYHSAERDIYVEQRTGLVVGLSESIDDYYAPYGDTDPSARETVLHFSASTDQAQDEVLIRRAAYGDPSIWPWVAVGLCAVFGVLALIMGMYGAFRRLRPTLRRKSARNPEIHEG